MDLVARRVQYDFLELHALSDVDWPNRIGRAVILALVCVALDYAYIFLFADRGQKAASVGRRALPTLTDLASEGQVGPRLLDSRKLAADPSFDDASCTKNAKREEITPDELRKTADLLWRPIICQAV